ncbi:hypothetical protein LEN26_019926 [Aphanomyces euteiches]|nr:hypothetical protein LEN26_019926 [Aphanomyces euteiches]KAH9111777.1 hypothetical protein AeMF1_013770 [Aphanomyces euteiches]KAH9187494.1 hypothetical protein AeNC1_010532 [Aphanomyces euteiches]
MKPVSHLVMDQDMLDCIIESIVSLDDAVKMEQIDVVHNYGMAPPPSTSYKTQILCEYIQVNPGQCLHESCQVLLPYHGFCSQLGGRDITTWLCTEFDDNVKLTQDHVVELPSSPSEIYKSIHEEVNGQCLRRGCINAVSYRGMCKEHGGTRRCKMRGCQKGSQGKNLCIAHGGGKRCSVDKCERSAQSHGLCKAHGGGARCTVEGCDKSSQGGGKCRKHGGGRRCKTPDCTIGAQRGDYCASHGGSRICSLDGCGRTDRGGGLCEIHRRHKTCSLPNCKRLAQRDTLHTTTRLCLAHQRALNKSSL